MTRTLLLAALFVAPFTARADDAKPGIDAEAKAIVEKAIEAQGGKEALAKYKASSSKVKGEMALFGLDIPFTGEIVSMEPDKIYSEIQAAVQGQQMAIVQVVNGDKEAVDAILDSEIIQGVSFVGSTPIAQYIYARATANGKRAQCFGGAKNHMIVMPDADIDQAADALIGAGFGAAGERCMAISVAVPVGEETADRLIAALVPRVETLKVGDGTDKGITIGPLINDWAVRGVMSLIDDSVSKGASILAGGNRLGLGESFIEPTLLTGATDDMRVSREEIFGPVLPIFRFEEEQEVIDRANDTEVGLACYFYSRDVGRVFRVSDALEYGMVGINEVIIANAMAPFGGVKESGQGREGSKYGLDDYLEIKYMCMGGIDR